MTAADVGTGQPVGAPGAPSDGPSGRRLGGALAGVATVARLEFFLRIRAGRWRWLLGAWFVVLAVVLASTRTAFNRTIGTSVAAEEFTQYRGAAMFGVLMLIVLGLSLLVCPALAAQSVNGDRERGTLATLQVTRLRPAEIVGGKLAASWGTALVFLALTLPLAAWCYVEGGLSVVRVLGVYAVMALLVGVTCAIALALSALLARTTTSSVLSYLCVFALTVGTLVGFGLTTALTQEERSVSFRSCPTFVDDQGNLVDENGNPVENPAETACSVERGTQTVARPDRVWWMLAPNPFVILADSAPAAPSVTVRRPDGRVVQETADADVLGALGRAVREVRTGPVLRENEFGTYYEKPSNGAALWPLGLAVEVLIGIGAVVVASRRLRTPTYRLARGQRIA